MDSSGTVDSQGSSTLRDVVDYVEGAGAQVRLARVKPAVRALLERDGVVAQLGADHLYGYVLRGWVVATSLLVVLRRTDPDSEAGA